MPTNNWYPGIWYLDMIGDFFRLVVWPFMALFRLGKWLVSKLLAKYSKPRNGHHRIENQRNQPTGFNTAQSISGQDMQYQNAYDLFCSFGDCINTLGTQSFSITELESYGLSEQENGTYTGTTIFADGTALGLTIGMSSEGTVYPHLTCVMVRRGDDELARIDWNENAKRNRDKWVHVHFYGNKKHHYFNEWEESKQILFEALNINGSSL